MKKIIFGITGLTLGGAERVLVDIANRLIEKYDVTIFTIYNKGELEKELNSKIHLISLYDFRYKDLSSIKRKLISLKVLLNKKKIFNKYIDNENYFAQIAFLEGPITRIFSVKSKKENVAKIAWVHNDISKVFGRGIKAKIKRIIDRNIYEKYDTLAFVSIDNLDKFNKVYDDMDLPHEVVINNYIDSNRILKLAEEKIEDKDIKNKLFDRNFVNIIQVSRLVEQKAIDRLIKVHTKLINEGNKHKIFVIGDGPLKEKLENLIKENKVEDTFILLGAKQNPYPYVKEADYFGLFSNFEGYPMVIEEAKILRKYILSTNTATREALINYSKYNKIVDNSEEGIEEAIKFAIDNKEKIKNIEKNENNYLYDNDKIINKIIKVIDEHKKHIDRAKTLE